MVAVHLVRGELDDEERRDLLCRGDVLVFADVGPMHDLCALVDKLARETDAAALRAERSHRRAAARRGTR